MIPRREFFSRVAAAFAAGLVTALPEKSSAGKTELIGVDWGAGESVTRSFLVRFPDGCSLKIKARIYRLANGNLGLHPMNDRGQEFRDAVEIDSDQLVALDDRAGEIRDKPLKDLPPLEIENIEFRMHNRTYRGGKHAP
jgi:hypothetical protein